MDPDVSIITLGLEVFPLIAYSYIRKISFAQVSRQQQIQKFRKRYQHTTQIRWIVSSITTISLERFFTITVILTNLSLTTYRNT